MMGCLLEGSAPDLRDVLFIRTTVLRNLDIYAPLNLSSHIKEANYDVRTGPGRRNREGHTAKGKQCLGAGARTSMRCAVMCWIQTSRILTDA